MTRDEERRLALLAQRGDQRAFETLLSQWEPLIRRVARYHHSRRPSVPVEDIEQAGRVGFWSALASFRHEGGRASSHCMGKARWMMARLVRDDGRMKRSSPSPNECVFDVPDHRLDRDGLSPEFLARLDLDDLLALAHPRHQEILRLTLEGYTHQEISERYGFCRTRMCGLKQKAFKQIRKKLRRSA